MFPDFGDTRLDVVPSDIVAHAIAASSREPATSGRIFHLSSGANAVLLEELRELVTEEFSRHGLWFPPPRRLSRRTFASLARAGALLAPGRVRGALRTLPVYLDYLADRQSFGNAEFCAWAQQAQIELPKPQEYLRPVLRYYLSSRGRRSKA